MRPNHKHKTVLVIARGRKGAIAMSSREAASQLGRSRGGQAVQRLGRGHRWTSKEASEMARRSHAKGARRRSARRRPRLNLRRLRFYYAQVTGWSSVFPVMIWYARNQWWQSETGRKGDKTCISERTALRHLGYTPFPRKGLIPERIISATPGSPLASQVQPKEVSVK